MNSGLYVSPGCSATACAAATARRLAEPVTKFSKRWRVSTCTWVPTPLACGTGRAQTFEYQLRDAAQRLEDTRTVQCVTSIVRHAAEVDRIRKLAWRQDQIRRQILFVVLDHEWNASRIDVLLREVLV